METLGAVHGCRHASVHSAVREDRALPVTQSVTAKAVLHGDEGIHHYTQALHLARTFLEDLEPVTSPLSH